MKWSARPGTLDSYGIQGTCCGAIGHRGADTRRVGRLGGPVLARRMRLEQACRDRIRYAQPRGVCPDRATAGPMRT